MSEPAPSEPRAHAPATRGLRFGLGVVLVALLAAAFAIAFRSSLLACYQAAAHSHDVVSALSRAPLWVRVLAPALGGLGAGLVGLWVARFPRSHGVADVMEAVVLGRVRLSLSVTLLKSLASWLAIVSGGSLGREGPLIQFGGAVGHFVGVRLGLSSADARRLIAAGTAAGFAAAYNTPFAAVLFVLEVVAGVVVLNVVVPVLAATVLAAQLTRLAVGEGPLYGARVFALASPYELLAFAGVGVLGGLGAQGFTRLLHAAEGVLRRGPVPMPYRPALGGLVAGLAIALLPEVAGNGYEPLDALIGGQWAPRLIVLLLGLKVLATIASVASGSPGGVFTPVLLLGGGLGYLAGAGLAALPGLHVGPAGGYALVGMAAATAASTHAPLMAAVMVFELSGDYAIVLPLLLATAVATGLSRAMGSASVYGLALSSRGMRWELTLEGRQVAHSPRPSLPP